MNFFEFARAVQAQGSIGDRALLASIPAIARCLEQQSYSLNDLASPCRKHFVFEKRHRISAQAGRQLEAAPVLPMLPFFGTRPTEQPLLGTLASAKDLGEDNKAAILRCVCSAEVSDVNHIISRGFTGHLGRAILVQHAYNIAATEEFERMLATGRHIICDILCQACGRVMGWKYLATPVGQEYKLGNYVLESQRVRKQNVGW